MPSNCTIASADFDADGIIIAATIAITVPRSRSRLYLVDQRAIERLCTSSTENSPAVIREDIPLLLDAWEYARAHTTRHT